MLFRNRLKLIAGLVVCALAFATCNKKWDDHNAITDVAIANNLFENINKNSSLAKFTAMLVKTGYDKVIAGSKTYTVWAPNDAALNLLDPAIVADTAKLKLFVGNHIANQSYLANGADQRVAMLNGKYNKIGSNVFDSANISTANLYAANGVYHVIDKFIPRYDNAWEFMKNNAASPLQKAFFLSQDYNFFDASVATQTGVNAQGLPVYDTATGYIKKNHFLEDALDVNDESNQYTLILMNDAAFTAEYNKLSPWFKTGTADSTNKLTSFWLTKDLVFKGSYSAAQLPDTLLSPSGVKVPINKPSIIASYKTSNGWVHIMSKVDFTLAYKFPVITIQGENPTAFRTNDRGTNTFYRARFNPVTGLNFNDILMQNYNFANYYIYYLVKNVNSMRYNAFWVAVNDVQTTPLWSQRLAIDSTTNVANLPFVTVAYQNYTEVPLGQLSMANYRNLNLFVMGPTTASSSGGNNSIVLDYIKLVPAF